ncbi:hypothetical protein MMC27_002052 [Xylographa pallens]|nr:hypothetical protein [Xylographa pallens]
MATSLQPYTWKHGFKQASEGKPWEDESIDGAGAKAHYVTPPSEEASTAAVQNSYGLNVLRTWPTLYDGINAPGRLPEWWKPASKVDVLICGAGPYGLEVALSLVRQGVSFRILGEPDHPNIYKKLGSDDRPDKADAPLLAGRADGVQPRFLEALHSWGLAEEVAEEGPIIESTAIYKDGKKLVYDRSHQSDSRYRGLHIITQGQLERIYIRDLKRHQKLVERSTVIEDFSVVKHSSTAYPVHASVKNEKTGVRETVQAKFLVGADGAASGIRKQLQIPFDGVSTDIYWGILDCVFETDFPHSKIFGAVASTEHGGCVIIPRENGYIRIYTQIDTQRAGDLAKSRQAKDPSHAESGGRVDIHSITAEEVLEQTNRIFAPYTWRFAAPLSWFAVWRISERVARSFSSPDLRVHLGGDAAHVHSVMGAFGLNASIMDASNLAWKIGLVARQRASFSALLPTYDRERRLHARRIINVSGSYLRFICNSRLPLADLKAQGEDLGDVYVEPPELDGTTEGDLRFLGSFLGANGQFLLGLDAAYGASVVSPRSGQGRAVSVLNGVRAPNPRICFETARTGYLYDAMKGASVFHVVVFASDLQGPVRERVAAFSTALRDPHGFYVRYGGKERFNVVLVVKALPFETEGLLTGDDLAGLKDVATLAYDDRAPDEDAHYWYGVNHARGAVVVVRPDLWVGMSAFPQETELVADYLGSFLLPVEGGKGAGHLGNGHGVLANGVKRHVHGDDVNGVDGHGTSGIAEVKVARGTEVKVEEVIPEVNGAY